MRVSIEPNFFSLAWAAMILLWPLIFILVSLTDGPNVWYLAFVVGIPNAALFLWVRNACGVSAFDEGMAAVAACSRTEFLLFTVFTVGVALTLFYCVTILTTLYAMVFRKASPQPLFVRMVNGTVSARFGEGE